MDETAVGAMAIELTKYLTVKRSEAHAEIVISDDEIKRMKSGPSSVAESGWEMIESAKFGARA